jgi:hypothetical protein
MIPGPATVCNGSLSGGQFHKRILCMDLPLSRATPVTGSGFSLRNGATIGISADDWRGARVAFKGALEPAMRTTRDAPRTKHAQRLDHVPTLKSDQGDERSAPPPLDSGEVASGAELEAHAPGEARPQVLWRIENERHD